MLKPKKQKIKNKAIQSKKVLPLRRVQTKGR